MAIADKLKLLPEEPGVYIMLNSDGQVIYVGKAKILKNRVRQYFQNSPKPAKVQAMVSNIADFYYIITKSEIDALALENNLIKKYKPKYNILLKDDKTYPYIKVTMKDEYPSFLLTRQIKNDGNKYFGPFMGGISVKEILDAVQLAFSVRLCTTSINKLKPKKECLNYHIKRCIAPCAHYCSKEEYMEQVKKALAFLDGDLDEVEEILRKKMAIFAENEEFELALEYREKLEMLSKLKLKRITAINRAIDADIIAYSTNNVYSAVNILITRKGIMQGGRHFALEDAHESDSDAVTNFIAQYYSEHELPAEIITHDCDKELLENYFKEQFGKAVTINCAKKGAKFALLAMAKKNATDFLEKSVDKIKHKEDMTFASCERLRQVLSLSVYPKRMECYDISNISGVDKVASMVVFIDGEPDKKSYRRFKIKTVEGADDFASLQEVLRRRLSKLGTEEEERFPKPDLIVIDGGKGQLSSVKEIFDEMGIKDIELISLAKREEEIFTLRNKESVILEKRDYCLKMMQRLRDEAHRFAITYFRSLHTKNSLSSVLTQIDGIGQVKRKALIERFGTIEKIMAASEEELARVEGISPALAKKITEFLDNL